MIVRSGAEVGWIYIVISHSSDDEPSIEKRYDHYRLYGKVYGYSRHLFCTACVNLRYPIARTSFKTRYNNSSQTGQLHEVALLTSPVPLYTACFGNMHNGLCLSTRSCSVSFCHFVATISVGAVPFSTHAIIASRTSWRASLNPGTECSDVDSDPAWFGPAKYHGAFIVVGVPVQCLSNLTSAYNLF